MENAIDALKMAFAVLVFIIGLTVAIASFSQLNQVSQVVLASSDTTTFYSYQKLDTSDQARTRIVGLETIIPTLYKYYKENFTIIFLQANGTPLPLYESQTNRKLWGSGIDYTTGKNPNEGIIGKYYTTNENSYGRNDNKPVCSFDVDEETIRHEPWTGTPLDFKINLDKFLQGGMFTYPSGGTDEEGRTGYNYNQYISGGFINKYKNKKFKETLGEYHYDLAEADKSSLQKQRKKRVIIYQEIN